MWNAEAKSNQFSCREQPTQNPPARKTPDIFEQQCRTFDIGSFPHASGDFILDTDFVLDAQQLSLTLQVREKASQIFKHGGVLPLSLTSFLTKVSVAPPLSVLDLLSLDGRGMR